MFLRTLFLLLAAVGCYAVETPVLGSGDPPASGSIFPGGVVPSNTQVVTSNGTTLAGDDGLKYTAASDLLVVNHNAVALPATPVADEMVLQVGGLDATGVRVLMDSFGASANFTGRRANGTNAARTGLVNNDNITVMSALGYEPTTPAYTTGAKASIALAATETWSATANGTKFLVNLTPAGSTTNTAILSLTPTLLSQVTTDAATNTATVFYSASHATSGTAAAGFGSTLQVQGHDDGATLRVMSQIVTTWTTATSASRASKMVFNVVTAAATTTAFTLASTSATFASGFPVTISDTTASTTSGTGSLIVSGGMGVAGQITGGSTVSSGGTGAILNNGSRTTAIATGGVGFWRSGGTIGTAGDMVFQTDLGVTAAAYVFRAGPTTPITVATLSPSVVAGTTPGFALVGTSTITGGVTDGYNSSERQTPTYDAGTALTVTRHNYIDLNQVLLTGAGPAACTDAAVFRFNAATGTHKALAADGAVAVTFTSLGPTGAQTTIQGWMKINVNGTLRYIPFWEQEVFGAEWRESAVERMNHYPTRFLASQASRPYDRSNVLDME